MLAAAPGSENNTTLPRLRIITAVWKQKASRTRRTENPNIQPEHGKSGNRTSQNQQSCSVRRCSETWDRSFLLGRSVLDVLLGSPGSSVLLLSPTGSFTTQEESDHGSVSGPLCASFRTVPTVGPDLGIFYSSCVFVLCLISRFGFLRYLSYFGPFLSVMSSFLLWSFFWFWFWPSLYVRPWSRALYLSGFG